MEKIASYKDALKFVTDIISAKVVNSTLNVNADSFQVSLFIKHDEKVEVVTNISVFFTDSTECLKAKCNGFAAIVESLGL